MICQRSQLEPCHSRLQLGLVGGGFHQSNHRADRDRQESIVLQGEDEQLVEGVRALPSSKPGLRRLQSVDSPLLVNTITSSSPPSPLCQISQLVTSSLLISVIMGSCWCRLKKITSSWSDCLQLLCLQWHGGRLHQGGGKCFVLPMAFCRPVSLFVRLA